MPCPLNHYYKTPHHPLQVGTHIFEDISPLWIPLPWQGNKAISFYFTQTLVSKIESGTRVQSPIYGIIWEME